MLVLLKTIREAIAHWWSEFTLQTRLMAAATLIVSLLMSGLTFWAVNTIQEDARLNDTRFGRDLGILLATNVSPLIAENNLSEVARFSERFFENTSSVRYMLYADKEGKIFFGLPFWQSEVQNSLTIERRIQLPPDYASNTELPMIRQHRTPNGEVTDVFVPLTQKGKNLGVLAIGINPNPTVVTSSHLTRDVTIAVFVSIWVMVILGGVINALTITQPIKELVVGVKNIAAGNFKQRIDLPLGGELGELISSFNEMAERLESYEEQNIEELTAEKAKLETLVSTIADGAVLLDTNLQVILVNPTAKRIFGWENSNSNVVGDNVLYHLPQEVTSELTRPLYQMAKDEGDKEGAHFRVTLNQPTNRTVRILLTTVLDQYRESVKGIAMTVQDITREVELNEAKSHFISNVSHELRTPLFNIKSFIETLHEYGEDLNEEQRKEFLETANNETDRLTRLVNDVLELSRLESSCRIYHFEALDIVQPIEQTLRTYQLNAKDKGIELIQEVEPDLPPVLGHYDLLLQVFANLVGNALKFTSSGGKVAIRAYLLNTEENSHTHNQTPQVRIEVSDTGIGIAQEDQDAIFERFFRVENRVHTLEGTGLGLSIVRNIIEKHHTTVHLVSEVGVGTTFWFNLAVFQHKEEVTTEKVPVLPESSELENSTTASLL
ncbi:two-component system sensor histidine kinase NblS [Aerosakkonemataceae cyanobacterium BLCC-F154]|uniref:histidine kinase n=1 Tax=Floridaenema fluviatile BLCC-F154 TaxID=3153640 RepID=A0ABV4YAH2_9CYAN